MAMRARGRTGYPPRQPMRPTYEKFKPKSEWKYEDDATRLLVYLPGFVKEQIRVIFTRVANITLAIKVQGQRHVGEGRWSQFIETYKIPENCDANKISSNFEQGILSIVMPKIVEVKEAYADKEESTATQDISSRTTTREKAETSTTEKQREEKDVEAVSPKKEKSPNGQEETSSKTAALVDTAEKIDGNKMGSGGESASGKPQDGQGEASSKTVSMVDSTEKMDRKMVGSGSESASEKADGKSEKGQDDASTRTAALVDTVEKIDEKKIVSGGESEAIEKEIPAEAEKAKRSTEKSKEFSSALKAVPPNTEEQEKIIDKSDKSVNEERKKETTVGKSKDIKGESASASESEAIEKEMPAEAEKPERSTEKSKEFSSALEAVASAASTEVSTERQHLLLNIGTAILVIIGFGAYIFHLLAPNVFNF